MTFGVCISANAAVAQTRPFLQDPSASHAAPIALQRLADLIAHYARDNGVPVELAHKVIHRESRFNPNARNGVFWGLMQISHATARSIGYRGPAAGLLNPSTNLRYGMAYLGNAYRVAGGDQKRAMRLYASGFHYEAKRKGLLAELRREPPAPRTHYASDRTGIRDPIQGEAP